MAFFVFQIHAYVFHKQITPCFHNQQTEYTTMFNEKTDLKGHYGKPSEFALTTALEGIVSQVVNFWDKVQNDEIVGEKKKYLQALFNLNNELVEKYNANGGDATGYYMEWVEGKPYSVSLSGLID